MFEDCAVLTEMFETQTTVTAAGDRIPLHSNLSPQLAEVLYKSVLKARPTTVIEVGMAYGVSSLAILTALRVAGNGGRLISIDPNQSTQWQGCGIKAIERAGLSGSHTLIEDYDFTALPKLLAAGQRADFAFIDGWHTFDYTLVDFWYLDKMLEVGSVVGFDDCPMPAVDKAIRFVQSHRKYDELDVGLFSGGESYSGVRGQVKRLMGPALLGKFRKVLGRTYQVTAPNRYFRKTAAWEPDWDFFADF